MRNQRDSPKLNVKLLPLTMQAVLNAELILPDTQGIEEAPGVMHVYPLGQDTQLVAPCCELVPWGQRAGKYVGSGH